MFVYSGRYPSEVIVVGYPFKQKRYIDLHRAALHFPIEHFKFVPVPLLHPEKMNMAEVEAGEYNNAFKPFSKDPFGCRDEVLVRKKAERNPFDRHHPYAGSCPEMRQLFSHCEHGTAIDARHLPWSHTSTQTQ